MALPINSKFGKLSKRIKKHLPKKTYNPETVIKQLSKRKSQVEGLNGVKYTETDEYKYLMLQKDFKEFVIEHKNHIDKKYDLMIIVPAFNVEQYIDDCINSLLSQKTNYTYEIVIVNDGSTDNTGEVLSKYSDKDNIRIITQENKGVSVARNAALEHITGKYIMFVDSDDELKENAVSGLLDVAFKNNADIVEGSIIRFNGEEEFDPDLHENTNNSEDPALLLFGYPVCKVCKAELFENIHFPEGYIYEDSIIWYCIYPKSAKKYTISDIVYKYRTNENGICVTASKSPKAIETYIVSYYLWMFYYEHFAHSDFFANMVQEQIILNHLRTTHLDEAVLKKAFKLTQKIYVTIITQRINTHDKYDLLDLCLRKGTFEEFIELYQNWYKIN